MTKVEVGKTYTTKAGEFKCLFIDGDIAYMTSHVGATAYTWDLYTGKAINLRTDEGEYDIDCNAQ